VRVSDYVRSCDAVDAVLDAETGIDAALREEDALIHPAVACVARLQAGSGAKVLVLPLVSPPSASAFWARSVISTTP